MQKTLKAKIQNAISLQSSYDAESPALFVGGRRRNRKKRKNKNGQKKHKTRKGVATAAPPRVATPSTPDSDSAYEDLVPIYSVKRPLVSCLDIREPVFYDPMTSSMFGGEELRDSVYNSNDSLVSLSSGHDSGTEHDDIKQTDDVEITVEEVVSDKKGGFPRTNSRDSGVYDDGSVEDAGYGDEMVDEITDEQEEQITDDAFENSISDECFEEVFKDDDQVIECIDLPTDAEGKHLDDFDDIDLADDQETVEQDNKEAIDVDNVEPVVFDRDTLENIREIKTIEEGISIVNFVQPEDEDEIIFDLSQLEVNNTQEGFSRMPKSKGIYKLSDILDAPTSLEDEEMPFRVPMDLLIDDDDTDEVLFEAAGKKKDLCITCNPLYEHQLREEEDRVSIKSYQGGFKTDFDNINLIQLQTTASGKTSRKPMKESSPLIKRQQAGSDGDNELACCVIL